MRAAKKCCTSKSLNVSESQALLKYHTQIRAHTHGKCFPLSHAQLDILPFCFVSQTLDNEVNTANHCFHTFIQSLTLCSDFSRTVERVLLYNPLIKNGYLFSNARQYGHGNLSEGLLLSNTHTFLKAWFIPHLYIYFDPYLISLSSLSTFIQVR